MANPYWTDGRLPKKPLSEVRLECGPNASARRAPAALGLEPYTVQTYQSWCGHTQESILFPRVDGSVLFIDVLGDGEAS